DPSPTLHFPSPTRKQGPPASLAHGSGSKLLTMILHQPKWLLAFSAVLVLWGAALLLFSFRNEHLANDLPRMTCDDLLQMGGRAAPQFVTLTDVRLCQAGHAFHRDMDGDMVTYVPVYSSKLPKEPPGPDLKLLLEILDDRELTRLAPGSGPRRQP